MAEPDRAPQLRGPLLRDAVLTFAAVLIAFAAFDDITTDASAGFTIEWLALGLCAAWLLSVSWRLIRGGHQWLGSVSAVALAIGAVAGSRVRPGTDRLGFDYLATLAALVWFVGLSGILATRPWWERPQQAAGQKN